MKRTDCGARDLRTAQCACQHIGTSGEGENVKATRKMLAALGVAVVTVTALVATSAPASAVGSGGTNKLFMNINSKKCIEIAYGSTGNFALAVQSTCDSDWAQLWNYNAAIGEMRNVKSGKCLEIQYSSTANFAPAGQYDCHGGQNQKWYFPANGLIANRHSGKCLEVAWSSTAEYAAIGQYDCHGGPNQKWGYN